MIPDNRIPTHPGEILLEEFLKPLGMTQAALATKMGIHPQKLNEIINGKRGVTPETALALGKAFDVSPMFWGNLQTAHDIGVAKSKAAR